MATFNVTPRPAFSRLAPAIVTLRVGLGGVRHVIEPLPKPAATALKGYWK